MDLSEEYINMCMKASEIQKAWKPQNADMVKGDFVGYIKTWQITQGVGLASIEPVNGVPQNGKYAWYKKGDFVWLPRQDQLQEIWLNNNPRKEFDESDMQILMHKYFLLTEYADVEYYNELIYNENATLEKLWLIIVMKEKYDKLWDGEKWINNSVIEYLYNNGK